MMLVKWRMTSPSTWFKCSMESIGGIISCVPQILGSHRLGWIVVARQALDEAYAPVREVSRYIALWGTALALLFASPAFLRR